MKVFSLTSELVNQVHFIQYINKMAEDPYQNNSSGGGKQAGGREEGEAFASVKLVRTVLLLPHKMLCQLPLQ